MIRLEQLKIAGFGASCCAAAEVAFDVERISLFVGDNEVGKSTIARALFAALYGLEFDQRRKRNSPLEHAELWRPADGAFGVELVAEQDGRELRIVWDFADGRLTVRDAATLEDLTGDFRIGSGKYDLGRSLLGIGPAEFAKVCFVAQGQVSAPGSVQGLADLVQRFAGSEQGDSTAADAIAALEAPMKRYGPAIMGATVQLRTEIRKLREQLDEIARRRTGIEAERERLAPAEERFQDLSRAEEGLRREAALVRVRERVARLREARDDLAHAKKATKNLDELRKESGELAELEDFPASEAANLQDLLSRRKQVLKGCEEADTNISSNLRPAVEEAQRGLEAMGRFAMAVEEDLEEASRFHLRASDAAGKLTDLSEQIESEEESLRREGVDLERLRSLRAELQPLSEDDRVRVAESETESLRLVQQVTTARGEADRARTTLEEINRHRAKARKVADVTVLLAILAAIAGALSGFMVHPALFALTAAGVAGIALGWGLRARGASMRAQEYGNAVQAFQEQDDLARRAEREREELDASLRSLVERCRLEDAEELRAGVRDLERLERRCRRWEDLRNDADEEEAALDEVGAKVERLARRFAHEPDSRQEVAQRAETLLENIRAALRRQEAMREAERCVRETEKRRADLGEQARSMEGEIRGILAKAPQVTAEDLAEAVRQFQRFHEMHERLERLQAEAIPQAERRCAEAGEPDLLDGKVATLARQVADASRAQGLDEPPAAPEPAAFYSDRAARVNEDIGTTGADRETAARQVMEIHKRVREELPKLDEEEERHSAALDRAERHQAALQLALDEMRAVARQVHGNWASRLNEQANEILGALAPTLETLRFDEDLNFRVMRAGTGIVLDRDAADRRLSGGQRDQLYLAVRLGIAAFAGGGDPLPLILDDPFVNFDDDRFRAAARFLAEHTSPAQQVILFTCHRRRFEWLRREAPDWFERRFAWREIDAPAGFPGT